MKKGDIMKIGFPAVLLVFLVFCAWLRYELYKANHTKTSFKEYLEREQRSNMAPSKSIEGLDYITLDLSRLPFGALKNHPEVDHMEYSVKGLAKEGRKIVSLTGITNTDLKLMYGASNLPLLTQYDNNFIALVTILQDWAAVLYEEKMYKECCDILEYAISIKSDVSSSYIMLSDIYENHMSLTKKDAYDKINDLYKKASSLEYMSMQKATNYLSSKLSQMSDK